MNLQEQKAQLRISIEERITHLSEEERKHASEALCKKLLERIPPGASVCAYNALATEIDLTELITKLISSNHPVFLPRYEHEAMTFHRIEDLDTLEQSSLSVLEPAADTPLADPATLDMVLVPGRAFDKAGNRLGRGKGGYDQWIAQQRSRSPQTKMWGMAFACQIVDSVPVEEHDQRMDEVIIAHA